MYELNASHVEWRWSKALFWQDLHWSLFVGVEQMFSQHNRSSLGQCRRSFRRDEFLSKEILPKKKRCGPPSRWTYLHQSRRPWVVQQLFFSSPVIHLLIPAHLRLLLYFWASKNCNPPSLSSHSVHSIFSHIVISPPCGISFLLSSGEQKISWQWFSLPCSFIIVSSPPLRRPLPLHLPRALTHRWRSDGWTLHPGFPALSSWPSLLLSFLLRRGECCPAGRSSPSRLPCDT